MRGHGGRALVALLGPGTVQVGDGHVDVVAAGAAGLDLAVALKELAVVPRAVGVSAQLDAGQRRGVGDVEGERARPLLAGDRRVGDDGRAGVERELVAHLLHGGRGAVRGSFEGERVTPVGQFLAVLVHAVEHGVLAGELARLGVAGFQVVQGLAHPGQLVGAHAHPGLVRVGGVHAGHGAQHAGARGDRVGRARGLRARGDQSRRVDGDD